MKRILCAFLILMLCVPVAFADPADLESIPLERLLILRDNINDEVRQRVRSDTSAIYGGKYVVGEDIKAGNYVLYIDSVSKNYVNVYIQNMNDPEDYTTETLEANESYFFQLKEGYFLKLEGIEQAHLNAIAGSDWLP